MNSANNYIIYNILIKGVRFIDTNQLCILYQSKRRQLFFSDGQCNFNLESSASIIGADNNTPRLWRVTFLFWAGWKNPFLNGVCMTNVIYQNAPYLFNSGWREGERFCSISVPRGILPTLGKCIRRKLGVSCSYVVESWFWYEATELSRWLDR